MNINEIVTEVVSREFGQSISYQQDGRTIEVSPLVTVITEVDKIGPRGVVLRVTYQNHYGHYTKPDVVWRIQDPASKHLVHSCTTRKSARSLAGVR